jgi:hypothetical protein
MIRRKTIISAIFRVLALSALVAILAPVPEMAAQTDYDRDGFSDDFEGNAVSLCSKSYTLNYQKKDVFVLLIPAANGYFSRTDFDPLKIAKDSLQINIHKLDPTSTCNENWTRAIPNSNQKALRIKEDLSTLVKELGSSTPGLPSGRDDAKIYTARIRQEIDAACPPGTACQDKTGEVKGADALFDLYIQNIVAHELAHMLQPLAQPYSTKIEWHDKTGSGYVMDQFIVASKDRKTGVITIPISNTYKSADISLLYEGSLMP